MVLNTLFSRLLKMSSTSTTTTTTDPTSSAVVLPTTSPSTEVEKLKSYLEVYRLIFDIRAITQPLPILTKLRAFPPSPSHPEEPTIYKYYYASDRLDGFTHAVGMSSIDPLSCNISDFDEQTSSLLQRAYMKLNQCDFSLEAMLSPIREKLEELGAQVEWLVVEPRAKILLQLWHDDEFIKHSVFGITSSSGAQYVADFTIEQFGHTADDWFTTQADYLERFTSDGKCEVAPESHQKNHEQTEFEIEELLKLEMMCWDLDWKELETMDRKERLEFVREAAIEAFEDNWDDDGDVMPPVSSDTWSEYYTAADDEECFVV
jgi:hypothetical protein